MDASAARPVVSSVASISVKLMREFDAVCVAVCTKKMAVH
jgi:hypothetical protein